jgi:hypothetical protein
VHTVVSVGVFSGSGCAENGGARTCTDGAVCGHGDVAIIVCCCCVVVVLLLGCCCVVVVTTREDERERSGDQVPCWKEKLFGINLSVWGRGWVCGTPSAGEK